MTFKEDITNRIHKDFSEDADKAFALLQSSITKTNYLHSDRVIRCIVFLAKGNLVDLNTYIKAATVDTRDIMLWAEYEKSNNETDYKRLRDFDHTFEESSTEIED